MKKVILIVKKIRRVYCLLFGAAADYQVYYVGSQFIFLSWISWTFLSSVLYMISIHLKENMFGDSVQLPCLKRLQFFAQNIFELFTFYVM